MEVIVAETRAAMRVSTTWACVLDGVVWLRSMYKLGITHGMAYCKRTLTRRTSPMNSAAKTNAYPIQQTLTSLTGKILCRCNRQHGAPLET